MTNKKTLFAGMLICLLLSAGTAYATPRRHSVGLQAGFAESIYRLNAPTMYSDNRSHLDSTILNGFKLGVVYDATIVRGFGVSMGLNYTFGTHTSGWRDYMYTADGKPTIFPMYERRTQWMYHQCEVVVDWQYKFEVAKETFLMLYTGPSIQYAFSVSAKENFRQLGTQERAEMTNIPTEATSADVQKADRLGRINVTWGVGAGFQYKRYFLRGGYDFGIINPYSKPQFSDYGVTANGAPDDRLTRGRLDQWQIKIGVYFWQSDK
ncbi:MAG: outer membrane beta-barrel protein [Paludibacteraceae bacterium]|nr:outer membrane beta-barrel protein [Paludibacteraceae bacterium]